MPRLRMSVVLLSLGPDDMLLLLFFLFISAPASANPDCRAFPFARTGLVSSSASLGLPNGQAYYPYILFRNLDFGDNRNRVVQFGDRGIYVIHSSAWVLGVRGSAALGDPGTNIIQGTEIGDPHGISTDGHVLKSDINHYYSKSEIYGSRIQFGPTMGQYSLNRGAAYYGGILLAPGQAIMVRGGGDDEMNASFVWTEQVEGC